MPDAETIAQKKAKGICVDCSRMAESDRIRCSYCLFSNNKAAKKYNAVHYGRYILISRNKKKKRIMEGRCRTCGRPLDPDADAEFECCNCSTRIK